MQSLLLLIFITVTVSTVFSNSEPYQGYRAYRSPLREGSFDHTSLLRFSDTPASIGSPAVVQPRFGRYFELCRKRGFTGFRDYIYPKMKYGSSSPMYVFDGRLYNLATPRS